MMNDDAHNHAAPQLAETLSGADRSSAARRGRALVVIIAALVCLTFGGVEARCNSTPILKEQGIEDFSGTALDQFYTSLRRTRDSHHTGELHITRVLHYGDSHVAADILTGALRRAFVNDFGDAGPGFLLAGKPYVWSHREGVRLETSAGWRVDGLGAGTNQGAFGLAGLSVSTNRAGEGVRLTADANRFTLYLLKQTAGGQVTVALDGEPVFTGLSLDADQIADDSGASDDRTRYVEVNAELAGLHTIELRTLTVGPVRVLGVAAERDESGVVYDAFGINGARATRPLSWDWDVMASNLTARRPDLIVIAYGSNEVGDADFDPTEYETQFAELLRRFHEAAPEASLLVIAPPDRATFNRATQRWQSIQAMPALVAAQRRAARSEDAAFWNLFQAMGGAGSIARWAVRPAPLAQKDRVHLTPAGYRLVADALYAELMRSFKIKEESTTN